jgi:D-amino-acid dehydrogenase
MRIGIVGAGIIGVTTGFELASEGHSVTVFDQRSSVAEEASFAHAGLTAPMSTLIWPSPAVWAALRTGADANADQGLRSLPWLWRRFKAHRSPRAAEALRALQAMSVLGRARLDQLNTLIGQNYERQSGCLLLIRNAQQARKLAHELARLEEAGQRAIALEPTDVRAIVPELQGIESLRAAAHLPLAEAANARQFAQLLRAKAEQIGVQFRFQHEVLTVSPGSTVRIDWRDGADLSSKQASRRQRSPIEMASDSDDFDAVVLCAGLASSQWLTDHSKRSVMAPVLGWTLTMPLRQHEHAPPTHSQPVLVDASEGVSICQFGHRLRVSGGAVLRGSADACLSAGFKALFETLDRWLPGVAHAERAQKWHGYAPTTPDGLPLLGPSAMPGVWLNTAHGAHGWSLAPACARVLAELIAGKTPSLDVAPLRP